MEDRTDRKSSKFLTVQYYVTWFAAPIGMFVCFMIATKTAGIIGLLFTLLLAWNIYRHYSDGNFPESKSGEDLYRLRSTDILRLMLREELTGLYPDGKMLPLGAALRRTLLAVLWAALNLAVILRWYYTPLIYAIASLLFLFFVWRFSVNGTYFYLIRKAGHSRIPACGDRETRTFTTAASISMMSIPFLRRARRRSSGHITMWDSPMNAPDAATCISARPGVPSSRNGTGARNPIPAFSRRRSAG